MDWSILFQSTLILFAIVNPIGSIPLFLQLTEKMPRDIRQRAFRTAVFTSAAILLIFVISGRWILTHLFQIQLQDLMAAGGLLLLIIAIDHLVFGALMTSVRGTETKESYRIGAVPMACPILAGPGAMMTVLVTYSEHGALVASAAVLIVSAVTWGILHFIDTIYHLLGEVVCLVLSKVLCLFIAAIGIRLLMQGVVHYLR